MYLAVEAGGVTGCVGQVTRILNADVLDLNYVKKQKKLR